MADEDRKQAGQDDGHGHGLGSNPQQGAFANGDLDLSGIRVWSPIRESVLEVDQHDHPELGGQAGQGDEADAGRDGLMIPEKIEHPHAAGQGERQGGHDQERLVETTEGQIKQDEDDHERGRNDDLQTLRRALQIFELPRIGDRDTQARTHVPDDRLLQVGHDRGHVPASHIDINPGGRTAVLRLQHGRPVRDGQACDGPQGDLLA